MADLDAAGGSCGRWEEGEHETRNAMGGERKEWIEASTDGGQVLRDHGRWVV